MKIRNQERERFKNELRKCIDELVKSNLNCKDFLIKFLNELNKKMK